MQTKKLLSLLLTVALLLTLLPIAAAPALADDVIDLANGVYIPADAKVSFPGVYYYNDNAQLDNNHISYESDDNPFQLLFYDASYAAFKRQSVLFESFFVNFTTPPANIDGLPLGVQVSGSGTQAAPFMFTPVYAYKLWVGDTQVTDLNAANVMSDAAAPYRVAYDADSNTLTLTNYKYNGAGHSDEGNAAIYYGGAGALTVALAGDNIATCTAVSSNISAGVFSVGPIVFTGAGKLTAAGCDGGEDDFSYGIGSKGSITVAGADVTGVGGDSGESLGIYSFGAMTFDGGSVTAMAGAVKDTNGVGLCAYENIEIKNGADVYALGGDAKYSLGIRGKNVTISGAGTRVYALGGDVTVNGVSSNGIFADSCVTVNGGTVTAAGGSAHESAGIYGTGYGVANGVYIAGGTVTATGGPAGSNSWGIYGKADAGTGVTIGGGTVTATGGPAVSNSAGISGDGTSDGVHITGGTVYATGGPAGSKSAGVWVEADGIDIGVNVSYGGTVYATGGPASTSCGILSEMYSSSGNCDFAVRIADSAKVTAIGAPVAGSANCSSYGIKARSANGGIGVSVVPGGQAGQRPTVVAAAGAAPGGDSWGIHGKSVTGAGVYIVDGDVTATGSASGGTYGCSYGIWGESSLDCGIVVGGVANGLPCGPKVTAESGACAATIVGMSTGILGSTREGVAAVVIACKADVYAVGGDTMRTIGIDGQSAQGQRKGPGVLITDEAAVKAIGGLADQSGETSNGIRGSSAGDVAVRIAGRATVTAIGPATAGNGRGINGTITVIEDQVRSVEAVGGGDSGVGINSCANAVAGLAWADADAAGDSDPIPVSDDAQNLTGYKVVCFPAHSLSYALEGEDTIKATCTSTYCDLEGRTATLTVVPPAEAPADGSARAATLSVVGTVFDPLPAIVYKQGSTVLPGAPTEAGDYTAYVTFADCTAIAGFTIGPEEPKQQTQPQQQDQPYYDYGAAAPAAYPPVIAETVGGTVEVSPAKPVQGATVTVALHPAEGYEAAGVAVTDAHGADVATRAQSDGTWQFTQPGSKVTVAAEFREAAPAPAGSPVDAFIDVKQTDWFYGSVKYCVERGIMNGMSDTEFGPALTASRAMVVRLLWNLAGQPVPVGPANFSDVEPGRWYSDAIDWAYGEGIVKGYEDGTFGVGDDISREALVTILYRFAQRKGWDTVPVADLSRFGDANKVSGWADQAMRWAVAVGIIKGNVDADGSVILDPAGPTTRAQLAAMVQRFAALAE